MKISKERGDYIAGKLKQEDWVNRKAELAANPTDELWADTFESFLMTRLASRYLKPIEIIQSDSSFEGEGFAIVSIQCALLEFLAALKVGKNYRHLNNGERLGNFEYSNSSRLFCDFLLTEEPFKKWFVRGPDANSFYANVRCALLHEARTKDGWRIWASGDVAVDPQKKLVRRDTLQKAIIDYIACYSLLLIEDKNVQEAFIRKFDHLAIA